ncbi:MAG: FecR family protein [Bacteroidota bacterium]
MTDYLKLITRELSNEISFAESQRLKDWVNESKENELFYRRFCELWKESKYRPVVQNQEEVFQRISRELGLAYPAPQKHQIRKISIFNNWRGIAAAIALMIISGWFFLSQHEEGEMVSEVMPFIIKSNPSGKKSLITLPDGSIVKLNSDSYIEYPEKFGEDRMVKLVGEAFFDVSRDTLHPFIISTGDIQVKVLGTSFNVKAFPFEESMTVAVASGKVLVEKKNKVNNKQVSTLLPSEMVSIYHKTGAFHKSRFDPDILAWRDGVLVFKQASFTEIVERLERWYGVDIIVERSTPIKDGFTGRYENAALDVILKGMSFSSDFSFQINGDTVLIK